MHRAPIIRSHARLLIVLLAAVLSQPVAATEGELRFIDRLPSESVSDRGWLLLDTRAADRCKQRSLKGARCLSADELLGPNRRLPSLRDIAWLLGTLGLSGDETVVIAGRPGLQRDFVAGVLHLAGQRNVWILRQPLARLIAAGKQARAKGRGRGMSREVIYSAHPRDGQIILRQELWQMIKADQPLRLLDGRSDAEYWGERIRGYRGGHIPGAEQWVAGSELSTVELKRSVKSVFYAHDPLESIALFVRMQAREKNRHSIFIEGWRSWAAAGSLPADAESFNERGAPGSGPISGPMGARPNTLSNNSVEG